MLPSKPVDFLSVQYYYSGRLSQHLLWLACLAGVAGLLASRALVALSPVVGVLAVLANPQLPRTIPDFFRNGAAMRASALVGFLALSGLYTSELATWRHELYRNLTWLGVSLAFTLAVQLTERQRLTVGCFFVLGTAGVGLATLVTYLLDPAEANKAISIGQNMQAVTRIFHIYFGLMLAQACFWGIQLRRHPLAGPVIRGALAIAALIMALTLHVLAYRTGLLVFYVGLLAYTVWLLTKKHWAFGFALLVLLVLGPLVAYHSLESVQQRVASSVWDVQQYTLGRDINHYSLARRLAAAETASHIIKQNWLLGVAPADAYAAMMEQYRWRDFGLQPANWVHVHNQYLSTLVGGGLVGLALWLALMFWPLVPAAARRNPYISIFILTQATVMIVTDVLSLQIGLNLFVFGYGFLVVADETARNKAASATSQNEPNLH